MSSLTDILSTVSAIAGITAAGARLIGLYTARSRDQATLAGLERQREIDALNSSELNVLGRYLYSDLGSIRLSTYGQDPKVGVRVRKALDRVGEFLGESDATTEVPVEPAPATPTDSADSDLRRPPAVDEEMAEALEEVRSGEVWNGLARMRRHIELTLSSFLPDTSLDEREPVSAGRLIATLSKRQRIGADAADYLRYAVQTANAAIHGRDVPLDVAEEAWVSGNAGLTIIGQRPQAETE